MIRGLVLPVLAVVFGLPLAGQAPDVLAFVQSNCAGCHNATAKSGGLDLTALRAAKTFESDREDVGKGRRKAHVWRNAASRRSSAAGANHRGRSLRWLKSEFDRQDRLVRPEAGQVSARRLNRAEYNNTIRDLLGIDIRPADNFSGGHGGVRLRQYQRRFAPFSRADGEVYRCRRAFGAHGDFRTAADEALGDALPGPGPHQRFAGAVHTAERSLSLRRDRLEPPYSAHFIHRFPVDAEYSFRLVLNGHRPNQSEPAHPALFIDNKLVHEFEVDATDLEGQIVECRTRVTRGRASAIGVLFARTTKACRRAITDPIRPSGRPSR